MASEDFAPVLDALAVMETNVGADQKKAAHKFLEDFQKSQQAWTATVALLGTNDDVAAKMFAATTLKGKIVYDLDQLPRNSLPRLRDTLINMLREYRAGPRPIRTQLCVSLANLAIQMTEWKDVLPVVGAALGEDAGNCILEFLQVLPEEINEGRKINLSDDDLKTRTTELLLDNSGQVLQMLVNYSKSSSTAASNPHLLNCITSWLKEIPVADVVRSPLLDAIIGGISSDESFESAVECMCAMYWDTHEVDACLDVIQILYPRVLALRPKIPAALATGDPDTLKGITRLFTEAAESWSVLTARMPTEFRGLVEAVLECCDSERADHDAVRVTFNFWYELKQMVTVEKFAPARDAYRDLFSRLVDVMTRIMRFPVPEGPNPEDPFDGDLEQEEKFRHFRHELGDVLKACCEVVGPVECLTKEFDSIKAWSGKYGAQATDTDVPHWQELEAPLFALRGMGAQVPRTESEVLPQVIPLIVQIPAHSKLRFQAIMALGRYTEWTAAHPEFLQPQIQFIFAAFEDPADDVRNAAALAFSFFGEECRELLQHELGNLHGFYEATLDKLQPRNQLDFTQGVAFVIAGQSKDKIYAALKLYCDPVVERLKARASKAQQAQEDDTQDREVADIIKLLGTFFMIVHPYYESNETNQAVQYCQEILPVLAAICTNFPRAPRTLEALCTCWRDMVLSYRHAAAPLLPELARQLAAGFETTHNGCFLWTTDAVLREFAIGAEDVAPQTSQAVYAFFEQQAFAVLNVMNELQPQELPDVIYEFFRLLNDALIYYHDQLLASALTTPVVTAVVTALSLELPEPLRATLHFLLDLLSHGTDQPHASRTRSPPASPAGNASRTARAPPSAAAAKNQAAVRALVGAQGAALTQRLLTGMMFHFPRDADLDAANALLGLMRLAPAQAADWVRATLAGLPPGSLRPGDAERLLQGLATKVQQGDERKVRMLIRDFANGYRRRHVAPREGLGRLGR